MKLKYLAILTFAVTLFFAGSMFGQEDFSFKNLGGEWKGTFEYANFSDDRRVKMNILAEFIPAKDGKSAKLKLIYDDFGKVYRGSEIHKVDLEAQKYSIDENEFSLEQKDGRFILLGSGEENGKKEPFRYTIQFDENNFSLLRETRTPFKFRHIYNLKRVARTATEPRIYSVRELNEDFVILKRTLVELHPGLYRYNTPGEMEKKFGAFEAKLNKPLTDSEFFKLFAQMISEVKCYHTYPNPIAQTDENKNGLFNRRNYFPFYFQIVGRRMIVTENASSKDLARGSEITKINGVPLEEVIEQLLTATYADGLGTVEHRLQTLELNRFDGANYSIFDMIFPLFFPPLDNVYKLEVIDFKTKQKTKFEVLALTRAERSAEMEKRYGPTPTYDDDWKFEIWPDNTAYLKMDNFLAWRLSFKIEPFFAAAFAEMRLKNVENLIIDIRGAGGGYDGVYTEIFRYLSKNPFPCKNPVRYYFRTAKADADLLKYASSWDPKFKENLARGYPENIYRKADNDLLELLDTSPPCEPTRPYADNFQGKTYLLVSSKNASAAFTLPFYAKQQKLATLVGQETGGNLRGFNGSEYLSISLPNSQFEFDISLLASVIDSEAEDSGVLPDVWVDQKPEDVGNGFDRELFVARELIGKAVNSQR